MPASDLDNLLYWSDADDLNKRDRTRAGPSDEHAVIMWSIYSPLLFIFSFVVVIVSLAIVTNPKVRRNPFNKYILFLSFPDWVYTFFCAITCLLSALNDGYYSWGMCQFQTFYLTFGSSANAWLNGLMAWEVYKLLRSSYVRRRYFPPSDRQVYLTSFACYGIALFSASLPMLGTIVDWLPQAGLQAGFLCLQAQENLTHMLVFWLFMAPIHFVVPYLYAAWVFYDVVFRSKLLPPKGKRRELTVFFFRYVLATLVSIGFVGYFRPTQIVYSHLRFTPHRIGAMFLFLWMPTLAVMFIFQGMVSPWWSWGLGLFSHTQGLVSALITIAKQDIREAVRDMVFGCFRCLSSGKGDDDQEGTPSQVETAHSTGIEFDESARKTRPRRQRTVVDEFGLPIQGSNFQFLDEASIRFASEARGEDEMHISSASDGWTENPKN